MLPPWARNIVLSCCLHDHGNKYNLHVAIVMPDHVHLILCPLINETRNIVIPLPEIMKGIKVASAHMINRRLQQKQTIWQEESFDHVLRSSESLDQKVRYILENPIRRGLVKDWRQYPGLGIQMPVMLA